jgi:hypothetical protein
MRPVVAVVKPQWVVRSATMILRRSCASKSSGPARAKGRMAVEADQTASRRLRTGASLTLRKC